MSESFKESPSRLPESEGVSPASSRNGQLPNVEASYNTEIVRKAIHFLSLSIPVIYYFVSRSTALLLLIPVTTAFFVVDVARYYHRPTAAWFYRTFGWLLRSKEQDSATKRLNGATFVLLSATLCVFIFPKILTIIAFAILIISDSTAALVGRRFGKRPFFKKTLEGSLAFFVSAVVVVFLTPKATYTVGEYFIGIVGGAVGAVVEAISIDIDDNLSIPVAIGFTMWLMYYLFYPSLDLSKLVIP